MIDPDSFKLLNIGCCFVWLPGDDNKEGLWADVKAGNRQKKAAPSVTHGSLRWTVVDEKNGEIFENGEKEGKKNKIRTLSRVKADYCAQLLIGWVINAALVGH